MNHFKDFVIGYNSDNQIDEAITRNKQPDYYKLIR